MSNVQDAARSDNTAGTAGIIYQFYAALEACFMLKVGQVLVVEKFGDVTVLDDSQIEIKQYGDHLTDSHENFWNTLLNWIDVRFDDTKYHRLVLLTTQQYGARTRFLEWNLASSGERLKILEEICADSERRYSDSLIGLAAEEAAKRKVPESLQAQRKCLARSERLKLERVLPKISISAGSAGDVGLHDRIKQNHCHTIATAKMDFYVNGLLGFACGAKSTQKRFEISYDDFKQQCERLGAIYCKESRQFPRIRSPKASDVKEVERHGKESLFALKIRDINYVEVLNEAVRNYLDALNIVEQEFRERGGYSDDYTEFAEDVESALHTQYRSASGNLKPGDDVIAASQRHYDAAMLLQPPAFPGRDNPSHKFRNGVIHILCDEAAKNLKWRVG